MTYDTLKSDEKYYKKAIKENKLSESFIKSLADKIDKLVKKDKNEWNLKFKIQYKYNIL